MGDKITASWIGCTLSVVGTAMQTEHVLQVISIVLTCIATLTTIGLNLFLWYKKAKEDGKIDAEEAKEGAGIVIDGVKNLQQNIEQNIEGVEKK